MIHYIKSAIKLLLASLGYKISRISNSSLSKFKVIGQFVDSNGNRFERLQAYKKSIWPADWKTMNEARAKPDIQTVKKMNSVTEGRNAVLNMEKVLRVYNLTLVGKDVLEIGCFSGASTYALAEYGARHVEGIDIPENFANLLYEQANMRSIGEQSQYLKKLREATAYFFKKSAANKVNFYDLDVKNLIKQNCYDLIVSWYAMEHIIDPEKAFKSIYSALRPEGICFIYYQPFFCISGGHFDTLDFPWGHVRLPPRDFDRYIQTYRPQEYTVAKKRFYTDLNRMTMAELRQFASSAGFEILELLPTYPTSRDSVDQTIFSQCKALYPSLTVGDLIAGDVYAILKKPS